MTWEVPDLDTWLNKANDAFWSDPPLRPKKENLMEGLDVRLDTLLKILNENRSTHRALFEEAVEGYRTKMTALLEDHLERIRKSKTAIRVTVTLPVPEDHTKDYDRAIRQVELAIEAGQETMTLDEYTSARLLMDDWEWKAAFAQTTAMYAASMQS